MGTNRDLFHRTMLQKSRESTIVLGSRIFEENQQYAIQTKIEQHFSSNKIATANWKKGF
jgi:hypothetical protein